MKSATDDDVTRENLTKGRLLVTLAALLAIPALLWLAPVAGCWGTLRLARCGAAGATAAALAACLPTLVILTVAVVGCAADLLGTRGTLAFHPALLLIPGVIPAPPLARLTALRRAA